MLDHYKTLQISENASMAEVRAAYKKRLSEVDSLGLTKSEKKHLIYNLNLAYEVLGFDKSRMEYDISWESNPARQVATESKSYNRSERQHYRKKEGYNKSEKGYSKSQSNESTFSRLFQKSFFQWILAIVSIFGFILIVFIIGVAVNNYREKVDAEEKFQKRSIEFVQTLKFDSIISENANIQLDDVDAVFYGLSQVQVGKDVLDTDKMLRSIHRSNASEVGLDSAKIHHFFNSWKNSHCYSSSRLNIATFYAPEIESDHETYSREEFRLQKVKLFKAYPNYIQGISSIVKFVPIEEHKYQMVFIKFVKKSTWEILPGYIEFEVISDKIQITREDFTDTE